jgi:hypothetical protein
VEIPSANSTFLQSKVKAANPTVELLKPSHRVLIMEKMQTADIATPATSAQPQDRKKQRCRPFVNCVRNPLVAISVRSARNVRLHSAPPLVRRLPTTFHHNEGVAHVMRATTRYQDPAKLKT